MVLVALQSAMTADPADTSQSGSGSFKLVATGEAVRPERPAATPSTGTPSTGTPSTGTPSTGTQIKSKAQYTRTALHVARSLDPDATETMEVSDSALPGALSINKVLEPVAVSTLHTL